MFLGWLFSLNLHFNPPDRLPVCERGKISLTCLCLDVDDGSMCSVMPQMLPAICWTCLQLWHTVCSCRCALRQISWLPAAYPCNLGWTHPAPSVCSEEDEHLSNWKETWKMLSSPTQFIKPRQQLSLLQRLWMIESYSKLNESMLNKYYHDFNYRTHLGPSHNLRGSLCSLHQSLETFHSLLNPI